MPHANAHTGWDNRGGGARQWRTAHSENAGSIVPPGPGEVDHRRVYRPGPALQGMGVIASSGRRWFRPRLAAGRGRLSGARAVQGRQQQGGSGGHASSPRPVSCQALVPPRCGSDSMLMARFVHLS